MFHGFQVLGGFVHSGTGAFAGNQRGRKPPGHCFTSWKTLINQSSAAGRKRNAASPPAIAATPFDAAAAIPIPTQLKPRGRKRRGVYPQPEVGWAQ
jgi:hypothetical protein